MAIPTYRLQPIDDDHFDITVLDNVDPVRGPQYVGKTVSVRAALASDDLVAIVKDARNWLDPELRARIDAALAKVDATERKEA